jgi:hypothetical protein
MGLPVSPITSLDGIDVRYYFGQTVDGGPIRAAEKTNHARIVAYSFDFVRVVCRKELNEPVPYR